LQQIITKNKAIELVIQKEASGETLSLALSNAHDVETDEIKLMNERGTSNVDNLITLSHLHEPAILHSLHIRFIDDCIYTYTGQILLAVNPFKKMDCYDAQVRAVKILSVYLLTGRSIF
jgi:myosin heavy subunit